MIRRQCLTVGCVAALLALAALGACGGAALEGRTKAVDDLVTTARDNGAERCAPVELAMAESHNAFAKEELSEGDSFRAREELRLAEENAQLAVQKSPKALCEIKPADTDRDGLVDKVDKCPKNPEDKDKFQDEDGCPDTDNDSDGLADASDRCPNDPEDKDSFQDDDGCAEADNDKDGLADASDKCPNDPEDKDGFQDDDGCAELDNDSDGLADTSDKCPIEAEDKDGFQDDDGCPECDNDGDGVPDCPQVVDLCPNKAANTPDGCPEYKNVVVTQQKIEIKQTIYFEFRKAVIKSVSFPLLNEVAKVLKDNPEIRVRIEGHTDDVGSEDFNMRLSNQRVEAVLSYLVSQGIDASRMESQGFGESKPVASNKKESGRAQNRRVEFVILNR